MARQLEFTEYCQSNGDEKMAGSNIYTSARKAKNYGSCCLKKLIDFKKEKFFVANEKA